MLPAWATVTLSIVSALAAIAAGAVITYLRIRFDRDQAAETREHDRRQQEARLAHEREEAWRDRLVQAGDDFATGVQQALLAVGAAIVAMEEQGDRQAALAEADRTIDEAVARLGRVKLLFGEDSEVREITGRLIPQLRLALAEARLEAGPSPGDTSAAREALRWAFDQHEEFNRAAFEMISRPRWRVGASLKTPYRIEGPADAWSQDAPDEKPT